MAFDLSSVFCASCFFRMKSQNGESAMEVLQTTPIAPDVKAVLNIEPAKGIHSNHVPKSPKSSGGSTSDD